MNAIIPASPCMYIIGPSSPRDLSITSEFQGEIELNWLPPTEPNGEVHYVIYYTPEGGTEQSVDTGSNLTHYNLTGLEMNRVYTNIAVQAVNSVGSSVRSDVIAQYNHSPPGESWCMIMHTYFQGSVVYYDLQILCISPFDLSAVMSLLFWLYIDMLGQLTVSY